MNDQHRGATAPGLGSMHADRRIVDISEHIAQHDPLGQSAYDLTRDGLRTLQLQLGRFNATNPIQMGMVVHAIPYLNWYRVQLSDGGSFVPACCLAESSFMPLGVRSTSPIPPFSTVLCFKPPGIPYAIILGVIPEKIAQGHLVVPDWLVQGGQSGLKRETAHKQPLKNLYRGGGVIDFSSGRPIDATALEWGKMSETGIGILIDSFQAYLRVNEACGLFLNYFDSHTRLAGVQLDVVSAVHEFLARNDEGEARIFRGEAIYPYEALGLYAAGTDVGADFGAKDVQYTIPKGALDLPDGDEDTQPIYRAQAYGGYLGQGYQRFIMKPARLSGRRKFQDTDPDEGLFHEHIAMDGSLTVRSAKSWSIGKRALIPIPKEQRLPEDQFEGDDARKDNYKFSGQFGGGDDHKVGDVQLNDEPKSLLRVAGIADLLSYAYNWKGLHPFHYHQNDYHLPQESDSPSFTRATDKLDFSVLEEQDLLADPEPQQVHIDDRYGEVNYYQRESQIAGLEDGSLLFEDGGGARIALVNGKIRIDAPGGIEIVSGKQIVCLSWDMILRAKNSVDISAAQKDVRIKAERNMQVLAGNSGEGGILLESKATEPNHEYQGLYGEDVSSSGIILRAASSEVAALANEIYLRTGGGPITPGNITIDAAKGTKALNIYSDELNIWNAQGVNIWNTASQDSTTVIKSHHFGPSGAIVGNSLIVNGQVCFTSDSGDSELVVKGSIFSTGAIAAGGGMADKSGGELGKVPVGYNSQLGTAVNQCDQVVSNHRQSGTPALDGFLTNRFYTPQTALGNDQLLGQLMFSFRDPPGPGTQYKTEQLQFLEPRWVQLVRFGMATGGTAWDEPAVLYQGSNTYPWPGQDKWLNNAETMLRLDGLKLYDAANGRSKDRPGPYEDPQLGTWGAKTTMASGLKTIL